MLSFEWSVKGLRMIVDPGVFEYNPAPHRIYARAAASHNTVTFDDAEICEFFGAFRCGRRRTRPYASMRRAPIAAWCRKALVVDSFGCPAGLTRCAVSL
jgi:Heparinase II/III-like protein